MLKFLEPYNSKNKMVFKQLLNQADFEATCSEVSACFIAFLPPLEETSEKERLS